MPSGADIQALHDALPASGGVIELAAGTYTCDGPVTLTKPDVTLRGIPGQTIVQRGAGYVSNMIAATGTRLRALDIILDGNGLVCPTVTGAELSMNGPGSRARGLVVRNYRQIGIDAYADDNRVEDCEITGMNDPAVMSYGIWLGPPDGSRIDIVIRNNLIRNNGLNGILGAARRPQITGNVLRSNHIHSATTGGGHIALGGSGALIEGNTIVGGSQVTSGLELNCIGAVIQGNWIEFVYYHGIILQQGGGYLVGDNVLTDIGYCAIGVTAGLNNFTIVHNSVRATSWQTAYGIWVAAGPSNAYQIAHNWLPGAGVRLLDEGTGINKIVKDNLV